METDPSNSKGKWWSRLAKRGKDKRERRRKHKSLDGNPSELSGGASDFTVPRIWRPPESHISHLSHLSDYESTLYDEESSQEDQEQVPDEDRTYPFFPLAEARKDVEDWLLSTPMIPSILEPIEEESLDNNHDERAASDTTVSNDDVVLGDVMRIRRPGQSKVETQLEIMNYISRSRYISTLLRIFYEDHIIGPFLVSFQYNDTVSLHLFESEVCRTLGNLFEDLDSEARDVYDSAAISYAKFIVKSLAKAVVSKAVLVKGHTIPQDFTEIGYEDIWSDAGTNESLSAKSPVFERAFAAFQLFLLHSTALQHLRSRIHELSHPSKPPIIHEPELGVPPHVPQVPVHGITIDYLHDRIDLSRIRKLKARIPRGTLVRGLIELGQYLCLLEPPCLPDKQRLHWTCKCGETGFDDLLELSSGGFDQLKYRLGSFKINIVAQTHLSSTLVDGIRALVMPLLKFQTWLAQPRAAPGGESTLPRHNTSQTPVAQMRPDSHLPPNRDAALLLCCMPKGKHGKRLHQDPLPSLYSDLDFLIHLRNLYFRRRGKIRSMFTLRELRALDLVKFQLFTRDVVDIIPHDVGCREASCECVPPMHMIEQYGSSQPQYRCQPVPPDTAPPFPPTLLMHLFNEPGCIDSDQTCILEQVPKRVCGELRGLSSKPTDGWGIYFQEGWSVKKLVWLVLIMFVLSSLVFGVTWSLTKGDIQGAFGVASWLVTLGAIVLTLLVLHTSDD